LFLNQAIQSASRWHFDIAHECGHLVMHAGQITGSVETEAVADRYASALLMPGRAFSREFGGKRTSISWAHIFELKRHWRVSVAAIIRRAFDLDLIGAVEYRRSYQYMSAKGWRTGGEPHEPDFQQPELLKAALTALGKSVRLTVSQLCQTIHFTPETFAQVTGFQIPPADAKPPLLVVGRSS
jgi:Zn-dependent peptidase ImmA (M78 family)